MRRLLQVRFIEKRELLDHPDTDQFRLADSHASCESLFLFRQAPVFFCCLPR